MIVFIVFCAAVLGVLLLAVVGAIVCDVGSPNIPELPYELWAAAEIQRRLHLKNRHSRLHRKASHSI